MTYPRDIVVHVHNETEARAIYRILSGVSTATIATAAASAAGSGPAVGEDAKNKTPAPVEAEIAAVGDDTKRDAAGTPFDPARHTGSIVKSGLWRMKAGLSRGAGEGEDAIPTTGTASGGTASTSAGTAATGDAEEEDEFAEFANASKPSPATAARTWSDTDLSKLNNQAAGKLGGADKIKALIAEYVPAGTVQHSRSIPAEKREEYATKLEGIAGIEFEG